MPNSTPVAPPQIPSKDSAVFDAGAQSLFAPSDTSAFNILRYPDDLASPEHPHWVMFNVVVRKGNIQDQGSIAAVNFDYSKENRISADAAVATSTAAGSYLGAVAGAKIAKGVNGLVATMAPSGAGAASTLLDTKLAVTTVAVAGGAAAGAAALDAGLALAGSREQVLLKTAIALYLPQVPAATYSAQWNDQDVGIVGASTQLLGDMVNSDSPLAAIRDLASGASGALQAYMLQQTANPLGLGSVTGATQSSTARVNNPFKTQLFKTMGFRKFEFSYKFLPKSVAEYTSARAIIQTFKKYMHPSFGRGAEKFILNYPAEFVITYFYKEDENEELFRISNCALTDLSVSFGASDFTVFREGRGSSDSSSVTPGSPTEMNLKLTFMEMEILSQERIDAGY